MEIAQVNVARSGYGVVKRTFFSVFECGGDQEILCSRCQAQPVYLRRSDSARSIIIAGQAIGCLGKRIKTFFVHKNISVVPMLNARNIVGACCVDIEILHMVSDRTELEQQVQSAKARFLPPQWSNYS